MNESPSPAERRIAEEVRALPEPRARAEFRARLRAEFVSGEITARERPRRATVIPFPVRAGAVLALAAALAGVFLVLRTPRWEVVTAPAAGEVRLDGERFAAADAGEWTGRLAGGVRVAWSGEEPLVLMCPERLAIQLLPGAAVTLPDAPRARGGAVTCTVESGAVQFATGPRFPGARLTVHTDPVDVAVTGTMFAVIRGPDFTCVCVLEGGVSLEMPDDEVVRVPAREQHVVHDDGRLERFDGLPSDELVVLQAFRDKIGGRLGRPAPEAR